MKTSTCTKIKNLAKIRMTRIDVAVLKNKIFKKSLHNERNIELEIVNCLNALAYQKQEASEVKNYKLPNGLEFILPWDEYFHI